MDAWLRPVAGVGKRLVVAEIDSIAEHFAKRNSESSCPVRVISRFGEVGRNITNFHTYPTLGY